MKLSIYDEKGVFVSIDTNKETIVKSETGPGDCGPMGVPGINNLIFRSIWSKDISYSETEIVLFEGELYVCIKDNTNKPVNDINYWKKLRSYKREYNFEEAINAMRNGSILCCCYGIYKISNDKLLYKDLNSPTDKWKESAIIASILLGVTFTDYLGVMED